MSHSIKRGWASPGNDMCRLALGCLSETNRFFPLRIPHDGFGISIHCFATADNARQRVCILQQIVSMENKSPCKSPIAGLP